MYAIAPQWPPDYRDVFIDRATRLLRMRQKPELFIGAKQYYKNPSTWPEFINSWLFTYDPRKVGDKEKPVNLPFILFPKQIELVKFLSSCWQDKEHGLIEKSRDMGATWVACAYSLCMWLFAPGTAVGWGSRKQDLVDKIGDPDSIFEKIRMLVRGLPVEMLPIEFNDKLHSHSMKLVNPENGSTITGEVGDNIGRGGRKSIYFKDESAHYERPELIEAALGDNTDVQIDISSVNGPTNIFARRRKSGEIWEEGKEIKPGAQRVFIMDWRDHPEKDQSWYDGRREKAEREGLIHVFAQEVDRDYAASVSGALIPSAWISAAIDAHKRFPDLAWDSGLMFSGLDVADEGGDLNAQACRKGSLVVFLDQWGMGDTGQSADRAVGNCKMLSADHFSYDCIGVGAGVKAETNRLKREKLAPEKLTFAPWSAAYKPIDPKKRVVVGDPESPVNEDVYLNLKAQAGWRMRTRFEKTWKLVTHGTPAPVEELISIPSDVQHFNELKDQLSQPVFSLNQSGKIVIDKKPPGTKSPNLFDAVCIAFNPYKVKRQIAGAW